VDDREKRKIGEEIEPGGRPKAPGRLELLQRFINTYNHDLPLDWDRIGSGNKAQAWLRQKRLVRRDERISDADAARLRDAREAIRRLVIANHAGKPPANALRALSESAPLTVAIDARGRTALEPARGGVEGAIATLLGIVH
jgi:Putative stress-induced transcription regulator